MIYEALIEIVGAVIDAMLPNSFLRRLRVAQASDLSRGDTQIRGALARTKLPKDLGKLVASVSVSAPTSKDDKRKRKTEPNFVALSRDGKWICGLPIVRVDARVLPNERTVELPALGEQFGGRFLVLVDRPLTGKKSWMNMPGIQLTKADAEALPKF
ncbi:hypothetical protein J2S49_001106 [Arcanobacterium wilhelmae]|uniref:Uncharacterized protein n=1 Tax=Arcanobacterium wilhelmae TaxID=1803177 RepID=A0ABT9NC09_9ACTO|nr:hypothetical protein [Arcanobacterium wilhelmae]MDP9801030.1 hypothetical protein [Arcanobacterium wilhelmae]